MKTEILKLEDIQEKFNPRSDFSQVDELAASIKRLGLLQPIVVRKSHKSADEKKQFYAVVDGACRLRALKKLGQKEVPVRIIDAENAEEAQMAANLMRADLNVLERARGYERMVRLFPAKYNTACIAKMFGNPKRTVERLISVTKRIPAKFDVKLSQFVGDMDFEDLEILAQIPDNGTMEKVVDNLKADGGSRIVYSALYKVSKALDYSCDALTTGKLVSAGRAFVIKNGNGNESAYTTDEAAYKEAKDAYEKKNKQQYGSAEKAHKEKVVEKSEKQKAADRVARKKEKDARLAAIKQLPVLFGKFICRGPLTDEIHDAAKELFEKHVDSDKCRRLWAAFGIEGCSKVSSYELRGKTYDKVIKPYINSTDAVVKLLVFVRMGWKDGATPEQAWVEGMKK